MRERLEALTAWLRRWSLSAQHRGPEPGYGLTRPDLETLAQACRTRYQELSALPHAELTQLDWAGEDGHRFIELPGGLTACIEANEFDHEEFLEVAIDVYLVAPRFGQRIGHGPSFCRYRDGRFEPDDGWWEERGWEADWR